MTPDPAREWIRRGFHVLPIPTRSKKPTLKGWPALRITESNFSQYFTDAPQNIGVLLGEPYGSADLDLDCNEAIAAAAHLAPETGLKFGRASKRASHYFYRCDPPTAGKKFLDPQDKSCVCELRCLKSDGTVGLQTVVPPSIHESGELIGFEPGFDREPANIDAGELGGAVAQIAAAALLAKHWPAAGQGRHECELALAGWLARAGWGVDDAERFAVATYTAVRGHDHTKIGRVRESVRSTWAKGASTPTTGFTKLAALVGAEVAKAAGRWLGIAGERALAVPLSEGGGLSNNSLIDSDWRKRLIVGRDGPRPLLANAITALRLAPEWAGVLAYNEFAMSTVAQAAAPWQGAMVGGEWTDHEDRNTADWLQRHDVSVSVETAGQAVQVVARDRCFHPVRAYLDGLRWDGTKRIDGWLSLYLGVDPDDYTAAVGARWLISAAARIYQPGAKVDCCMILEGAQGTKKSTALKTIAGEYFTDELADLGSKDSAMQTRGVWIVEIAELDSMSRSDVGRIKSFMSRSTDRFRPPYGKRLIESPRQCVFAGSVNHSTYLRDETGGRRFWPVVTGTIRIDELERDRCQLWAEAVAHYRSGAPWWMDSAHLNQLAGIEQADRYEGDPWDEMIAAWLEGPERRYDGRGHPMEPFTSTRESVTVADVLIHCVNKPMAQWFQSDKVRVARCLRSLGFERHNSREGSVRQWRYRRLSG